jgi:hypothetical protein
MKTRLINGKAAGDYTDEFILDNSETVKNWELVSFYDKSYVNPFWNGSEWVESATAEELKEIENQKGKEIYLKIFEVVNELTTSALARATNKQGVGLSRIELENLKNEYKDIYEVAKSYIDNALIIDSLIFDTLEFEQDNDFTGEKLNYVANYLQISTAGNSRIEIYCKIIIKKFEFGELMLKSFFSFIRTFRSKMITFLEKGDFDKVNTGFQMVGSITNETTNEEITLKFNQFNLL